MAGNNDGVEYDFASQTLTLSPRVKHKHVRRAQNVMTEWMLNRIDVETLIGSGSADDVSIGKLLQEAMSKDPGLAVEIQDLETSMVIDQTIMLASGLDHSVLSDLKEESFEDEYIGLYEKCVELLGGNANSFFEVYRSGLTPKQVRKQLKKRSLTLEESLPE